MLLELFQERNKLLISVSFNLKASDNNVQHSSSVFNLKSENSNIDFNSAYLSANNGQYLYNSVSKNSCNHCLGFLPRRSLTQSI